MTITYDTGFLAPMRELIHDGIRAHLAPLTKTGPSPGPGFAHAIVDFPFVMKGGGQDDHELNLLFALLDNRSPSYAIATGDIRGKRAGAAGFYLGDMQVEIYCYSGHQRGIMAGRMREDAVAKLTKTADPGVWAMMELARCFLQDQYPYTTKTQDGKPIGSTVKELRYDGERELVTTREGSLWGVQFSLQVELRSNMLRYATQLLTEIMTRHHVGAGDQAAAPTDPVIITQTHDMPP